MRVLQVSDGYPPATGGLERTVQALAQELAERGHETQVATLSYPGSPATECMGNVTVRRLAGLTRHLQRFSTDPGHHFHPTTADPQLVRRLQEVVDTFAPDIVHAHGWMLNSALSLHLPPGTALVTTLHDYGLVCPKKTLIHRDELDAQCAGPSLRRCLPCTRDYYGAVKGTALTLGLRERATRLDRVTLFLPISSAVAEASLPGMDPDRYRIVPSFVRDDITTAASRTPRPDFLPPGDFLVFVGALGEHKGVGLLAAAHQRMQTAVPLVLIGSARSDTTVPPGSPDRPVIMQTAVPHDQIMAAFAAASVAVAPSRWAEPQGLVAVEAMAAGTPVVATRMGGLQEVVRDGQTGLLVDSGDVAGLAAALDRLLADAELRTRMGAAGRERAGQYLASAVIPALLSAYEDAVALRQQPTLTTR